MRSNAMRRNAMKSRTPAALLFSLLLASASGACAQEDYPTRPVQMVAPAAGNHFVNRLEENNFSV